MAAARDAVIFTFDTGLNTLWSANWLRQSGTQRIIGSFNNAAVGTAIGQANGIQAADRSRQVIALCGDGGFNMLMCEFLTAVHHKLPIKVVIYNNSAFGLIHLEAESIGLPAFEKGIQFPNPDFAAFARACGSRGFRVDDPNELRGAIAEALASDGPAIVDAVVAPDELPQPAAHQSRPDRQGRPGEDQGSRSRRHRRVTMTKQGAAGLLAFVIRCTGAGILAYLLAGAVELPHPLWACIFALISSTVALGATFKAVGGRVIGTVIGVIVAVSVGLLAAPYGFGALPQIAIALPICAVFAWRWPAVQLCLWTAPIVLMYATPTQSIAIVGFDRGCEVVIGLLVGGLIHLGSEKLGAWRRRLAPRGHV